MKWKVEIGYHKFNFDDIESAARFAETAVDHVVLKDDDRDPDVEITPVVEDKE